MESESAQVSVRHLHKSYDGVQALSDVSLDLRAGEIHALCGEDGAGKSTLIKCLTGVELADAGEVVVHGKPLPLGDVAAAQQAGIAVIHQETPLFPDLTVVENLFVGREVRQGRGWFLDHARMRIEAKRICTDLGLTLPLDLPVAALSTGQRKLVSIARALLGDCQVLILDEPTASLSTKESQVLQQIMCRLRAEGRAMLYVTHRLEEVFALSDRVTVLRDGQWVMTTRTVDLDHATLVRQMVGRNIETIAPPAATDASSHVVLDVRHLEGERFRDISLEVRAGEVVGLAGLVGAGRSELARALFGLDPRYRGEVRVQGTTIPGSRVPAALRAGMALVPEDRQHEGVILPLSVADNLTLTLLDRLGSWRGIDRHRESQLVDRLVRELHVKVAGTQLPVSSLSGGNQQKVVLGKWLAREPRVLLLDEPTAGIDVGAKQAIHDLIRQLARQGMATLLIPSDMSELFALCNRVLVMREGSLVANLKTVETTAEQVLQEALPR